MAARADPGQAPPGGRPAPRGGRPRRDAAVDLRDQRGDRELEPQSLLVGELVAEGGAERAEHDGEDHRRQQDVGDEQAPSDPEPHAPASSTNR